jgi:hypothetical protein
MNLINYIKEFIYKIKYSMRGGGGDSSRSILIILLIIIAGGYYFLIYKKTNSEKKAPGTTAPGTTAPGTTAPGTTAPGTTAPGTTAPGAQGGVQFFDPIFTTCHLNSDRTECDIPTPPCPTGSISYTDNNFLFKNTYCIKPCPDGYTFMDFGLRGNPEGISGDGGYGRGVACLKCPANLIPKVNYKLYQNGAHPGGPEYQPLSNPPYSCIPDPYISFVAPKVTDVTSDGVCSSGQKEVRRNKLIIASINEKLIGSSHNELEYACYDCPQNYGLEGDTRKYNDKDSHYTCKPN